MALIAHDDQEQMALQAGAVDILPLMSDFGLALRLLLRYVQTLAAQRKVENSLRDSEVRYRLLMEQVSEGIFIVDTQGAVLDVNSRICEMLGYARVDLLRRNVRDLINTDDLRQSPLDVEALAKNEVIVVERPLIRQNGSLIYAEISTRLLLDGSIQCFVRDTTERRLVEKDLYISQVALQTKSNSLTIINSIADTLYRSLDLQTVVTRAVEGIIAYTNVAGVNIFIYEEESQLLRSVIKHGIPDHMFHIGDTLSLENSIVGQAVRQREVIVVHDLVSDARISEAMRAIARNEGFKSFYALPLLFHDQMMGAISLLFREFFPLTPDELETLYSVAKSLGAAIANARYVEKLQAESFQRQRAEAAEREQRLVAEALRDSAAALTSTLYIDEVIERILDDVTRVVPCDAANVMLIEQDVGRVVATRGYDRLGLDAAARNSRFPLAQTPNLRWMVEHVQPMVLGDVRRYSGWVLVENLDWLRSYVGAPIIIDGAVIGFINLDSATPNTYSDIHAGRLQAFANQAGIAIRDARYYQALQQQAAALEVRVMERTAEVESERAQLHAILNSMTEGVIFIDKQGKAPYVNQALCQLTGYAMTEWQASAMHIGQRISGMEPAVFRVFLEKVLQSMRQGGIWQGQLRLLRQDDSSFDAAITAHLVIDPAQRVLGTVLVMRDISKEKALEEQKSRFVARASHELRTPLTNLKTRLYLIPKQPERFDEHLDVIKQVTQRMEKLVEDLLDLSRFERGVIALKRQDTVLQTLIVDVIKLQRPDAELRQITLYSELPPDALHLWLDPERITQVITNLVTNSIKYTPPGGQVTVRLTTSDTTSGQPPYAVISVIDTGAGIASQHLPYLFQPFYRADENTKGAGLGLSIAREIVELHGGRIDVESKVGVGTSFRVYLAVHTANSGT
ncbi:MAG: PAS domain S-box protein [Chloroflexi bacterium]|nr:PAS domain S-box protein [Chloroflexota bacterium]